MVVGHAVVGTGRELHAAALETNGPCEARYCALVLPERQEKLGCRRAVQRPVGVDDGRCLLRRPHTLLCLIEIMQE